MDTNAALPATREARAGLLEKNAAGGRRLKGLCGSVQVDAPVVGKEANGENGADSFRAAARQPVRGMLVHGQASCHRQVSCRHAGDGRAIMP